MEVGGGFCLTGEGERLEEGEGKRFITFTDVFS